MVVRCLMLLNGGKKRRSLGDVTIFLCFGVALNIICLFCYCSNQLWSLWCAAHIAHFGATEMGITSLVAVLSLWILVFLLIVDPFSFPFNFMQINYISSLFQELCRLSHPIEIIWCSLWCLIHSVRWLNVAAKILLSFAIYDEWNSADKRHKKQKFERFFAESVHAIFDVWSVIIIIRSPLKGFFSIFAKYDNHRLIEPTQAVAWMTYAQMNDTHIASHSLQIYGSMRFCNRILICTFI